MSAEAQTLVELMLAHAEGARRPSRHRFFDPRSGQFQDCSHAQLARRAFSYAEMLEQRGVGENVFCLVHCSSLPALLTAFYGAIAVGARPLILAGARTSQSMERLLSRVRALRRQLGERLVLLVQEDALPVATLTAIEMPAVYVPADSIGALTDWERWRPRHRAAAEDVAYLQETSASTDSPKLVAITHANVRAAMAAIHRASGAGAGEVVVSWLPLYHDMGLVGCELFSFWHDYDLALMSPFDFLKRPVRWLEAVSRFAGTMSPAPDFGYNYAARYIEEAEAEGLNLSTWKRAFCGAEPLRLESMERFARRFADQGFQVNALTPCYGLAEATLAVTFAAPDEIPKYLRIARIPAEVGDKLELEQATTLLADGGPQSEARSFTLFSVGKVVPGVELVLLDEAGDEIDDEGRLGEVVVRGDVVAAGYIRDGGRLHPFSGWVRTGDLAFVHDDDLYIVDRLKNIIIRNGENYPASSLEDHIAARLEVPFEAIAVFESDILDARSDVVALIEVLGERDAGRLVDRIAAAPLDTELPITRLVFAPARTIPRTTSGKKKHFQCRALWRDRRFRVLAELPLSAA